MRRSRRTRAEARALMRASSRVCRGVWRSRRCPARCAALRGAARPRRGAARSSCAAAGCWCPAPAPPPSRERCAQQPRAAGALCPLRRRAAAPSPTAAPQPTRTPGSPAATQIAQQPHRAATRHFSSPPETRTARGSCLYLPAGDRHPPRPIWRYRLRHLTLAAGTVFFLNSYSRLECSLRVMRPWVPSKHD